MPDTEEIKKSGLTREQKIGFALLVVFAVLAVGLGVLQIRNALYGPYALNDEIPVTLSERIDTVSALHYRDTDLDGLNDFDELYVYNTSPYLADTDSDGINDKTEIEAGKNPNCAEGRTCEGEMPKEPSVPLSTSTGAISPPAEISGTDFLSGLKDPKKIKEMLKNYGMEEELLKSIPDDELLKLVNDLLASTSTLR